jgi:long-chain acyl-CoA synthetase
VNNEAAAPRSRPFAWEASYPPGMRWDLSFTPTTLTALLDRSVAAHGAEPALRYLGKTLSYRALAERIASVAAGLLASGVAPGDAVALYLPNTGHHPVAFFACLSAGARVVPLTPLDPPRALARKLTDSGARTLISTDSPAMLPNALGLLRDGHATRLILAEEAEWGAQPAVKSPDMTGVFSLRALAETPPAALPAITPDDLALLQYTGGTTGEPRAAMLSHANLAAVLASHAAWNAGLGRRLGPGDRVICVLPLFHIYALTSCLLRPLSVGAEVLIHPRFDADAVLDDIEQGRATAFPGVPTMWIALVNRPDIAQRDLSSLTICASGGAALPVEVSERWRYLTGLTIGGGWGMTETGPAGTNLLPGRNYGPGAIGLPLPGIEMRVVALDSSSRVAPPGETGELAIRGPNVMRGYWNRPEETKSAFADGFFLTGDIGHMDEAGFFTLVDRKKEMILSGGFNVYPRVIEEAIHEHPSVEEAAVIGVANPYRGQSAKAFVRLRAGAQPFTLEELRAFLAERIGRHELPTALEIRDELPRTPVGKLAKRVLVEEEALRAR